MRWLTLKSNPLQSKIHLIQIEYKELLTALLPKLKSYNCPEALDEINLFWIRHVDEIQLYLKYWFPGENSYVFTAATFMDFEDKEHLPFLLMGDKHVLDDPLNRYSDIVGKMPAGKDAEFMYRQIVITAEDNLKILENLSNEILILPLRLLSQSNDYNSLYEVGEKAFISLFTGIDGLKDYFDKCRSFEDIMRFARDDIGRLVLFSEEDNVGLPFEERFRIALDKTQFGVDDSRADSYNFFALVFGCIQQAIDVIASCVEYGCIPYVRYPVALHYIYLLSESITDIDHINTMCFKMCIGFIVHRLCDKEKLAFCKLSDFIKEKENYDFNEKLFDALKLHGITEDNFCGHAMGNIIIGELDEFYSFLYNETYLLEGRID